jgi:hypothetical protein
MKIENAYNIPSFEAFCDSASRAGFADSYAGTVLARSLTQVDPRIFEKKFPELAFVNSGIEANNTGGYARRIQSLRLQALGGFTTAGDASGNKGKISLAGEDNFLVVVERESHSVWSDSEIKEADLQNINLPQRYIQYHNMIYMREVDQIGLVGVDDGPSTGLLTGDFETSSASGSVDSLTAQEMYDEIATLINTQRGLINNTPEYSANRVIMPTRVYNAYQSTILDTAAGSKSVLRALQDNYPDVQFLASPRGDTVDNGGDLATSTVVAYSNNSESMVMRIPQPLTVGEIIKTGSFDYKVDSKYRIGGLDVLEATSGFYLTGL